MSKKHKAPAAPIVRKIRVPADLECATYDELEAIRSSFPIPPTRAELMRRVVRAGIDVLAQDFAPRVRA